MIKNIHNANFNIISIFVPFLLEYSPCRLVEIYLRFEETHGLSLFNAGQ
jgi:hypothetical protein